MNERSGPVKLGIVGCGAVADLYHLPAVAASVDVALAAAVDPALDRARRVAERHGAARVLADTAELPALVEAAIVATPNHLHAPVAIPLLRAGVHCLVEKPLAMTVAQCDELAAAARAGNAVLAVGHDFRHFPVAQFAKSLFASGALGAVHDVDLRQSALSRWPYASGYVFSRELAGGGVLIDFGVHLLDLLGWWLGDLRVADYRDDAAGGVETECQVTLELDGGRPVRFELTRLREMRDTAVVRCERATVEVGIFEPALVRLTLQDGKVVAGDVPDATFARRGIRAVFDRQLADFVSAVRTGTEPLVPAAAGRRAVAIVEECYARREPLRHGWDWPEALAALERET